MERRSRTPVTSTFLPSKRSPAILPPNKLVVMQRNPAQSRGSVPAPPETSFWVRTSRRRRPCSRGSVTRFVDRDTGADYLGLRSVVLGEGKAVPTRGPRDRAGHSVWV